MKGWTHWDLVSGLFVCLFFKQRAKLAPFSLTGALMGTGGSRDPFLL